MTNSDAGRVTLKDVYEIVNRIEGRLEMRLDSIDSQANLNSNRISNMEGKLWIIPIVISVIISAIGIFISLSMP